MIFDAADILRVPWELVVKSFRATLGRKSFNGLSEYASEFFSFMETNARLFPPEIQKEILVDAARSAALRVTWRNSLENDDAARLNENDRLVQERRTIVDGVSYPACMPAETADEVIATTIDDVVAAIESWRETFGSSYPTNIQEFAKLALQDVLKLPLDHLSATGLVFAGFGDHDIFPRFVEYKSCGIIANRHMTMDGGHVEITHETPAWLASFAQTAMSDTFSLGISEDVYRSMMVTVDEGIRSLVAEIVPASGGSLDTVPNVEERVDSSRQAIGRAVLEKTRNEHAIPLRRVLSVLPVDEMAELAETLINLQSLKEKVTKKSETVGGPVDVAIITKNEGMLWIKRKHFFDRELNSRYFARQQMRYQT
jgi:hypothetical protein